MTHFHPFSLSRRTVLRGAGILGLTLAGPARTGLTADAARRAENSVAAAAPAPLPNATLIGLL